jgi:hypothetical protein
MSRVAIHQPNFLPWMGYLAKIAKSDYFIFLDNIQFSKGSFTNRSKILDDGHPKWLTIPAKPPLGTKIHEIQITPDEWKKKHLAKIEQNYRDSEFGVDILTILRKLYYEEKTSDLSTFNIHLIKAITKLLDLNVTFICSSEICNNSFESPSHRLVALIKEIGGTTYISGNGGRNYQDPNLFKEQSINVEYVDFFEHPYKQNAPTFYPGLSCIDTLCNIGIKATQQYLLQKTGK